MASPTNRSKQGSVSTPQLPKKDGKASASEICRDLPMSPNLLKITIKVACLLTVLTLAVITPVPVSANKTVDNYPRTVGTLEALSAKYLATWHLYRAYERQARKENLDEIAALFAAMAASQAVMAKRFQDVLAELGAGKPMCRVYSQTVGITRDNLRTAIESELTQTDKTMPRALKHITGEGYSKAIRFIQLVIDAKLQHRKKLETIYSYTRQFFGALTASFKKRNPTYFICMRIGTVIINKLPVDCPVHGGPTSSYVALAAFKTPSLIAGCRPG